jgi:hypothetical protein
MSRRDICTRFEAAPALRWRAGVLLLVAILPSAAPAAEPAGICALVAPAAGQDLETYFLDKPTTPARSLIAEMRRIAYEMWLLEALIDARFTIPGIDRNTIDGWSTPSSSMIELEALESIGTDPTYARRWAEANREILAQARRVATASPRFGRAGMVIGLGVYRVFQSAMGPVLWVDGVRAFAATEPPPIGITVDQCNDTELCFTVHDSRRGDSREASACLCFDPARCRQAAREAWWSKSPWVLALDRCREGKSCRDIAVRVDELLPPLKAKEKALDQDTDVTEE